MASSISVLIYDRKLQEFKWKCMWNGPWMLVNNHNGTNLPKICYIALYETIWDYYWTSQTILWSHEFLSAAKPLHVQWGLHSVCGMVVYSPSSSWMCAAQSKLPFWKRVQTVPQIWTCKWDLELKRFKSTDSDQILAELTQAGVEILRSKIHELIKSIWN
jgi:hypothetical protein